MGEFEDLVAKLNKSLTVMKKSLDNIFKLKDLLANTKFLDAFAEDIEALASSYDASTERKIAINGLMERVDAIIDEVGKNDKILPIDKGNFLQRMDEISHKTHYMQNDLGNISESQDEEWTLEESSQISEDPSDLESKREDGIEPQYELTGSDLEPSESAPILEQDIQLLVQSIRENPRFYYEIFINPNFIYDQQSAENMGAKDDGDKSTIKRVLLDHGKFLTLLYDVTEKTVNGERSQILRPKKEFTELSKILKEHLPLNLGENKQDKYRFSEAKGNLSVKLSDFAKKHGDFFRQLFKPFIQEINPDPEENIFTSFEASLSVDKKKPEMMFGDGKFFTADKLEKYKEQQREDVLESSEEWLKNLDVDSMEYFDGNLVIGERDQYGQLVKDSQNNMNNAKNKVMCLADLRATLSKDPLSDGAITLIKLKAKKYSYDKNDKTRRDFLDSLIAVAEGVLINKLRTEKNMSKNDLRVKDREALLAEIELMSEIAKNVDLEEYLKQLQTQKDGMENRYEGHKDVTSEGYSAQYFYSYLNKEQREWLDKTVAEIIQELEQKAKDDKAIYNEDAKATDKIEYAKRLMQENFPDEYTSYVTGLLAVSTNSMTDLDFRKQLSLLDAKIKVLEEKISSTHKAKPSM